MKHKYYLEIDCGGEECDRGGAWACYGSIVTEGDTLDELYENASVDIIDQDGGERGQFPADSGWMQDMIKDAAFEKYQLKDDSDDQNISSLH